jgi:hypothetical protein
MKSIHKAKNLLHRHGRDELASLLANSQYHVVKVDGFLPSEPTVEIHSPRVVADALSGLSSSDKKRIIQVIKETDPELRDIWVVEETIITKIDETINLEPSQEIMAEIICQKNLMINVATGGERINDVNDFYIARRKIISNSLSAYGIEDPNIHNDLWDWYNFWRENFSSYAERRKYINDLFTPLINQFVLNQVEPIPHREPTGWNRVDRVLSKAKSRLNYAQNEEDFQAIGLLCREIIISLAQAVYDPEKHKSSDGITPSETDAERQLNAFIVSTVSGKSNESLRRYTKASLSLALDLHHRRTANYRLAAICLEATSSLISIIAIMSGRYD